LPFEYDRELILSQIIVQLLTDATNIDCYYIPPEVCELFTKVLITVTLELVQVAINPPCIYPFAIVPFINELLMMKLFAKLFYTR